MSVDDREDAARSRIHGECGRLAPQRLLQRSRRAPTRRNVRDPDIGRNPQPVTQRIGRERGHGLAGREAEIPGLEPDAAALEVHELAEDDQPDALVEIDRERRRGPRQRRAAVEATVGREMEQQRSVRRDPCAVVVTIDGHVDGVSEAERRELRVRSRLAVARNRRNAAAGDRPGASVAATGDVVPLGNVEVRVAGRSGGHGIARRRWPIAGDRAHGEAGPRDEQRGGAPPQPRGADAEPASTVARRRARDGRVSCNRAAHRRFGAGAAYRTRIRAAAGSR